MSALPFADRVACLTANPILTGHPLVAGQVAVVGILALLREDNAELRLDSGPACIVLLLPGRELSFGHGTATSSSMFTLHDIQPPLVVGIATT